ncbi:MAG: hypothetical protein U5K69_15150 [Balneolaceae bacterium]|nr:hypothetical protein [Balneolaceae bacterium]
MKVTRLYTGDDGESHFEDIEIPLQDAGEIGRLSELEEATGIIFRETSPYYDYNWHNAPRRQYIIMLDGAVDVEIGDGTVRRFSTGDVLLAEDTTGRGHISRAVDNQPRKSIFVTLD